MPQILWLHILAGAIALLTFLVPLLSFKGGKLHRKAGWIYSISMLVVCFSAFTITPWRYFIDPNRTPTSQDNALFLFFIALFSLTSVQQGLLPLRNKKRKERELALKTIGLPGLTLIVAILMEIYGFAFGGGALFIIFAAFSLRSSFKQIRYWSEPQAPNEWWFSHIDNMFVACIATVTAFIVTALPRFYSDLQGSVFIWLLPTAVFVPWNLYVQRKYRKQFAGE